MSVKGSQILRECPFCGGEAEPFNPFGNTNGTWCVLCSECASATGFEQTEAEAIAAWNSRAAMEFDNWFYLPKPKEPIVKATETTHAWDGTKVKTDVFYQVQEQAVINWAKELDEHIIKRICEVWNSRVDYHGYEQAAIEAWESIKAWNNRAERICKPTEEYCCQCGQDLVLCDMGIGPNGGAVELDPPILFNYCPNCGCKVVGE